ncbi:MAG TPA: uracil-DNA glycosylase [Paludibacteraceae bacterium]|jgi:uracil-DNA glycosylase|nr:uracil-DNA glycosylase [Paludibacteraceae bacterium]HQB69302.1 uracil-DNA glycosylase [Paludibacteraceae bacterium]HRS68053.1 uracil-DNA glycosylase [Paludibacteraceae bacterium]
MDVKIESSWKIKLAQEFNSPYFEHLAAFVRNAYTHHQVFPPAKLIFNAFDLCPFDRVKVVIIGQDPYHGFGQAHGLSFSVNEGVPLPPSLRNIYQEIRSDLGIQPLAHGNLERWAKQGILLLNATLTVQANLAGSHQNKGWENFTDSAIKAVAEDKEHIVFLLWGNYAQQKAKYIDHNKHLVLKTVHPSPLSAHRGFFGCKHFSQTNQYLKEHGLEPINWM